MLEEYNEGGSHGSPAAGHRYNHIMKYYPKQLKEIARPETLSENKTDELEQYVLKT